MFLEEAQWIERALERRSLPEQATVLDVGSSSEEFRTQVQPHIEEHVLGPLRRRGAQITHLDAKHEPGIDVVADLTSADLSDALGGRQFDLVLCCNMLEHVEDREAVIGRLSQLVAPAGALLVTVPGRYRIHHDPIDTGFRPSPDELAGEVAGRTGFATVVKESVPIRSLRYYNLRSRYLRERVIEFGFWLVRPLRWRQTCVLLERP